MSDSVLPHRRQPTRLPRPWDSPGKNTGVGCQFLLQCMKVKSESEVARVRLLATPWTAAYQAPLSMGFSREEYWSGVPLPFNISDTCLFCCGVFHIYPGLMLSLLNKHKMLPIFQGSLRYFPPEDTAFYFYFFLLHPWPSHCPHSSILGILVRNRWNICCLYLIFFIRSVFIFIKHCIVMYLSCLYMWLWVAFKQQTPVLT